MYSTSERFKPAGHKAQELSEIVMPEEVFKPIQRVIDTTLEQHDRTIGYLFRDVECKKGYVGDVVLSKELLCDVNGTTMRKTSPDWQKYEEQNTENPQEWLIPSGPLVLELCYRSQFGTTPLSQEVQLSWHKTLSPQEWWLQTSTRLRYEKGIAHVYHDWTTDAGIAPVPDENGVDLSNDNTPCVNQFLHTILGKRSSYAQQVFEQYDSPVRLWTPNNTAIDGCALVLGVSSNDDDRFSIDASNDIGSNGPARGVALAKKLLKDKRYEVRDT
ncbi:TPA: hypothetical protein HA251_02340 [Candidatus Woesearchaeota archaeon]|nr:hypothetical protein [Candidatus Woesearchaeota archaeon]